MTKFVAPRPCSEANRRPAGQGIFNSEWNPKVHHSVHNSFLQVPILAKWNEYRPSSPSSCKYVLILTSHLGLDLPPGSSLQVSRSYHCTYFVHIYIYIIRATWPSHRIVLDLTSQKYTIILGDSNRNICVSWSDYDESDWISLNTITTTSTFSSHTI